MATVQLYLNGKPMDASLDSIAANFNEVDILKQFRNGMLEAWLDDHGFNKESEKIKQIKVDEPDKTTIEKIIAALNLDKKLQRELARSRRATAEAKAKAKREQSRIAKEKAAAQKMREMDARVIADKRVMAEANAKAAEANAKAAEAKARAAADDAKAASARKKAKELEYKHKEKLRRIRSAEKEKREAEEREAWLTKSAILLVFAAIGVIILLFATGHYWWGILAILASFSIFKG